jgi:transcriptional regulator with XRE-family HTH domain
MEKHKLTFTELADKTGFAERWLRNVSNDPNWKPHLDTAVMLSFAMSEDLAEFLRFSGDNFPGCIGEDFFNPNQVAFTLRTIRLEKNLSQSRLSAITHFQVSSISFRESNRYFSYPTLDTLEIYCKAFGISIGEFLYRAATDWKEEA